MNNSRYIALIFLLEACLLFCTGRAFAQTAAGDDGRPRKSRVTPAPTPLFEVSPGVDPKTLTFQQRNSGAFKRRKKGGMKDPGMAVLCSALVPGLGQIYNGQWWKTPIVYAGGAVGGYFIRDQLLKRKVYDAEIKARYDGNTAGMNPEFNGVADKQLYDTRNSYEQNFELAIILTAAWYLLNMMDAAVYAHLASFNISPDLTLSVKPYVGMPGCGSYGAPTYYYAGMPPYNAGLRLMLTF